MTDFLYKTDVREKKRLRERECKIVKDKSLEINKYINFS